MPTDAEWRTQVPDKFYQEYKIVSERADKLNREICLALGAKPDQPGITYYEGGLLCYVENLEREVDRLRGIFKHYSQANSKGNNNG